MIITFIANTSIPDCNLKERVYQQILKHIDFSEKIFFYCGNFGNFDSICNSVCVDLKREGVDCEIILVTPYMRKSQLSETYDIENEIYYYVFFPPTGDIPFESALVKRNKWVVSIADVVIAYVDNSDSTAYQTLRYAQKRKKNIVNLAE